MPKRNLVLMVFFTFLTCGIYNLAWMYLARAEFADLSGNKQIHPGLELLASVLCFPFFYFWIYKFSADIADFQKAGGMPERDNSILNLFLAIFGLGLISELLIQDQLNGLND